MNNALHSLTTLLRHAESERDDARGLQQQREHQLSAAKAQHQQLLDYRRDYEQRWAGQFGQNGTMEIVQCYHGFVGRLSMAIDQQEQVVLRAQAQCQVALQQLREHELRVASVGKLIARRVAEAQRAAERRDQKATDETASRLAWARMHASDAELTY